MSASASLDSKKIIGGDAKKAKFDRQLRLWGTDGQSALEAAHVVALGATPAITEALKSLVLTGVSTVTLVDERTATAEDAASNYFVSSTSVTASDASSSSPRATLAATVLEHVCLLGESCCGVAAAISPEAWVQGYVAAVTDDFNAGRLQGCASRNAQNVHEEAGAASVNAEAAESSVKAFMRQFPIVARSGGAATSVDAAGSTKIPPTLILVSERYADLSSTSALVQTTLKCCYPDVPVMLVRSGGFLGLVQVYNPSRVILRPHNPTQVKMEDLRMFDPFPALQRWFDAHNPDDDVQFAASSVDAMSLHSHLPYPCIIHHAFRRWWASLSAEEKRARQQRSADASCVFPLSAKEYREIASVVGGMIRRQSPPEEAFMEAMEKCTGKLNRPIVQQLPEGLAKLFGDLRCADPLRAVAELRARLPSSASPQTSGSAAATAVNASGSSFSSVQLLHMVLWTSPEVLSWFILHAVQRFVMGQIGQEIHGAKEEKKGGEADPQFPLRISLFHMPFCGYLPDFTTTTMWYRELQDIYHAKHVEDVTCIAEAAQAHVADALAASPELSKAQQQQLLEAAKPLLVKYTTTTVENIWELRQVGFSPAYGAANEEEWQRRLGQRLAHLTRNLTYELSFSPAARRAACLAVAALTSEELQRRAAKTTTNTTTTVSKDTNISTPPASIPAAIAAEAHRLASLAPQPLPLFPDGFDEADASSAPQHTLFYKACVEVARWRKEHGSVQLPSVAASTGALAAQEAVKLLMRIRVSSGDPLMYDGYVNKVYTL